MTTNIKFVSTLNAFIDNEAYNLDRELISTAKMLAAGSWVIPVGHRSHVNSNVLSHIFNLVMMRLPNFDFWCFVGNSAWQNDTRIIRHHKLWGGLKARGLEITHSRRTNEFMLEGRGKLKFFGASLLSELSLNSVVDVLAEEQCCYLIALPKKTDIDIALQSGWDSDDGFDRSLLSFALDNEGLIFKSVGEFDDPECGFVGVGEPELIKKLF